LGTVEKFRFGQGRPGKPEAVFLWLWASEEGAVGKRVSVASNSKLVLDGRSNPKLREPRKSDISDTQIEMFFATLVETCNVVRSAKAAGFSANWAYRRRKRDAAFRNAWAEAVREGYARLELVLLERAIKGTPKLVRTARGTDRVMRDYSNTLAIALLKRHAETADSASYQPAEEELAEIRERILERLDKLRARDGPPIETKSAAGRLAAIRTLIAEGKDGC
jgi:hypothetical protein